MQILTKGCCMNPTRIFLIMALICFSSAARAERLEDQFVCKNDRLKPNLVGILKSIDKRKSTMKFDGSRFYNVEGLETAAHRLVGVGALDNSAKTPENDLKIKERVNVDVSKRKNLIGLFVALMEKYPELAQKHLYDLEEIAKYDTSTGARLIALFGYVTVAKDKEKAKQLAAYVEKHDGEGVLGGG